MPPDSPAPSAGVSAHEYHERTKHSPKRIREGSHRLDFPNKPTPYKEYLDLPNVELAHQLTPPRVPTLAALHWTDPDPDDPGTRTGVDLDVLTQLCYYAAGVTKRMSKAGSDVLFRAAACTGALYHIDLSLVTGEVGPLDAGVYHFDPTTLSLDVLREGDFRGVLASASGGEPRIAEAPVTFVATSTWWRNAWKYRERTFRHAFWDSGTVLANLTMVANSLSRPTRVVTGFADEQVAGLVGVETNEEAPLALVPVGADAPVPEPRAVDPIAPETAPLSPEPVEYPLIHEAYVGSSLPDGDAVQAWREKSVDGTSGDGGADETVEDGSADETVEDGNTDRTVGTRRTGDGDRVQLDPVGDDLASKAPPFVTIPRRGSCREYVRDELNFRKVSTVLDRAVRGVPMDVRDPDGPALQWNDCYLLVNGVEQVDPGVYQFHPDAGELELLREGECRAEAKHLALDQALGGDGAICAYFMTDLDAVVDRFGDRGYRAAQFEASLAAGRLYLATYAHSDLGGTGLTFYDDEVTEFLSPRAAGQTPTFLYTLGRPA